MKTVTTQILPDQTQYVSHSVPKELDRKAICIFLATGFFLDQDSFYTNIQALKPAHTYTLDANNEIVTESPWFQWHYTPRAISFETALEEFTDLFETIIDKQVGDQRVILPLSGGLDSRTQAAALAHLQKKVSSYSYQFQGGYPETKLGNKIAKDCNFPFESFEVPKSYLWNSIDELAKINGCYSEFTHPRQMAFLNQYAALGDVFSLGHWGDVLFDGSQDLKHTDDQMTQLILKKIIKKGGAFLAQSVWENWGLEGTFKDYLTQRVFSLVRSISITNSSAKLRAFKSLYWAPRWTSTNLAIFKQAKPITLPYYHDSMCQFICSIPEAYLANRQLQIAYIKKRSNALASIPWQAQKPFNLYTYHYNKPPYNLPYRIYNKFIREARKTIAKPYIQRNWELQFVGKENKEQLASYLYSEALLKEIPKKTIDTVFQSFYTKDAVTYSHPLSMLLTLALRFKHFS